MPNTFAYIALFAICPVVMFFLFRTMPLVRAIVWSVVLAYLLLPQNTVFDLPAVPQMNRASFPNLMLLLMCVLVAGKTVSLVPTSRIARVLVALLIFSPIMTALTNPEPVVAGGRVIAGLGLYQAASMIGAQFLAILVFFVARSHLATPEAHREIIWALMITGAVYSLAVLFELRMSPQLHNWTYGFFPHTWVQHVRMGGYRPVVFLNHAIWLAFFMVIAMAAAAAVWRASPPGQRTMPALLTLYLGGVVVLCKGFAAMLYGLILLPLVRFAGMRTLIVIAAMMGALAVTYPALRVAGLVPTGTVVSMVEMVAPARASSLQYRLSNEDAMLDKAMEKPLFGWGFGRGRVYDDWSGADITTVDGKWIGLYSSFGWSGYIAEFGLLSLPLFLIYRKRREISAEMTIYTGTVLLLLGINMLDLLPNATRTPLMLMIAGAMLGYAESLEPARAPAPAGRSPARGGPGSGPGPGAPPTEPEPQRPLRTGTPMRREVLTRTALPRRDQLPLPGRRTSGHRRDASDR